MVFLFDQSEVFHSMKTNNCPNGLKSSVNNKFHLNNGLNAEKTAIMLGFGNKPNRVFHWLETFGEKNCPN